MALTVVTFKDEKETARKAITRLKREGYRLCNIKEVWQYWEENYFFCCKYDTIVSLDEDSLFGNGAFCTWPDRGGQRPKHIYAGFYNSFGSNHGILVDK